MAWCRGGLRQIVICSAPDPAEHFAAVDLRKEKVQDNKIAVVGFRKLQTGCPVIGHVDTESFRDESALHQAGSFFFVFNKE